MKRLKTIEFENSEKTEEEIRAISNYRKNKKKKDKYRLTQKYRVNEFLQAQNYICPVCINPITKNEATADHVDSALLGHRLEGNVFFTHQTCNSYRGALSVTACERLFLEVINLILGWNGKFYENTKYGRMRLKGIAEQKKYNPDYIQKLN